MFKSKKQDNSDESEQEEIPSSSGQDSQEQDSENDSEDSSEDKLQTIAENLTPEERTQLITILKNLEFKDKTSSDRMMSDEE